MATNTTIDERVLRKMAFARGVFKDELESHLGGALGEFYKAECARANGLTRWVEHWIPADATDRFYQMVERYIEDAEQTPAVEE